MAILTKILTNLNIFETFYFNNINLVFLQMGLCGSHNTLQTQTHSRMLASLLFLVDVQFILCLFS